MSSPHITMHEGMRFLFALAIEVDSKSNMENKKNFQPFYTKANNYFRNSAFPLDLQSFLKSLIESRNHDIKYF